MAGEPNRDKGFAATERRSEQVLGFIAHRGDEGEKYDMSVMASMILALDRPQSYALVS